MITDLVIIHVLQSYTPHDAARRLFYWHWMAFILRVSYYLSVLRCIKGTACRLVRHQGFSFATVAL